MSHHECSHDAQTLIEVFGMGRDDGLQEQRLYETFNCPTL